MIKPIDNYTSKLSLLDTEKAIKFVKDNFENELASALNLIRVSAPLFVDKASGLNDDLNGIERPVTFDILSLDKDVEIVQSLAKWKRNALRKYNFDKEEGLYTDMNAIRRDETLDNIHSVYVDQWDWEKIIDKSERNLNYLFETVRTIFKVLNKIEDKVNSKYNVLSKKLPDTIHFISTAELEKLYPSSTRKEREYNICKKYKAVFIYEIGWPLKDHMPHDGRAADYDDWKLNGDILVYDKVLDIGLELSSMGIRVDEDSILKQLEYKEEYFKLESPYTKDIINKNLPYTIGGGIGQSRICLFYLEKAHIGEVQSSSWSKEDIDEALKNNIHLL